MDFKIKFTIFILCIVLSASLNFSLTNAENYSINYGLSKKRPKIQTETRNEIPKLDKPQAQSLKAVTIAPEIPYETDFCGQKIELKRYDLRERYDREMMNMVFMHSSSILLIKRANRYFPIIEPILQKNGIPDDFKYLACIESGLNYKAVSPARAVGMWQLLPETARQYGLEVDDEVDERYDVAKATEAACKYLKHSYANYGDWTTVAASYNSGNGRMSKELLHQKAKSGIDLWLVDETMRYVFRIMSCKDFMNNPQKYGFYLKREQLYAPFDTREVEIKGPVKNWAAFADSVGVSYYDLKAFNTWIRSDSLDNEGGNTYIVTLPVSESRFYDKSKKIPVHQKSWVTDAD